MSRYGKETKLEPEEVLRRAEAFFGDDGLGLKIVEQSECCLSFEGSGGHVTISAARCDPEKTEVDLETREWDYQVKSFMQNL
ncbi:MAG: hypothetical protein GTN74_17175 [Proteobacteria bacterium]|nr:hypothetical protein [Pseudomonadota bacterium]NIS69596.1 hypothetical protein [Pseudomonadota bacterium]